MAKEGFPSLASFGALELPLDQPDLAWNIALCYWSQNTYGSWSRLLEASINCLTQVSGGKHGTTPQWAKNSDKCYFIESHCLDLGSFLALFIGHLLGFLWPIVLPALTYAVRGELFQIPKTHS